MAQAKQPAPAPTSLFGDVDGAHVGGTLQALADNSEVIGECVEAVVGCGAAIMFGSTRDQSAVFVRLWHEGAQIDFYKGDGVGLCTLMRAITERARTS